MRVLVTGGLGLVGAHLVPRLVGESPTTEVVIIDNRSHGSVPQALASLIGVRVSIVGGDVADPGLVDAAMSRCDAVIHLAASTSVDRSIEEPGAYVTNNVGATVAVVDALRRRRPQRTLAVSTDEVWGSIPAPELANEDTAYRPTNPYAASKAASDHIIAAANNTYELGISTVWFTTLYGPWQMPGKLISTAVRNRLLGTPVPIHGDGLAVREFTYVQDAVDGLLAVFSESPSAARYVIGSGVRYSATDAASTINRLARGDSDWVIPAPERPGGDRRYAVDSTRIRQDLGWSPAVSFEEGIERTVRWWSRQGLAIAGEARHHARVADVMDGVGGGDIAIASAAGK